MKRKTTKQTVDKSNVFYTKTGLDSEFVSTICDHIHMYLLDKGGATALETYDYIRELGISTVDIKKEEILSLLDRLVYIGDCEVSIVKGQNNTLYGSKLYKPLKFKVDCCPLSKTPCFSCPHASICSVNNHSCNPSNCQAFVELLKMKDEE